MAQYKGMMTRSLRKELEEFENWAYFDRLEILGNGKKITVLTDEEIPPISEIAEQLKETTCGKDQIP